MQPKEDASLNTLELLRDWSDGDQDAGKRVFVHLYDDLKGIARRRAASEHHQDALGATELLHETYLRLVDQTRAQWQDRNHFFAVAARVMRRITVDKARERLAAKRGRGEELLTLSHVDDVAIGSGADEILALERCLIDLGDLDPDRLELVELRFFAGLSLEETADLLGQSRATIVRRWKVTRGWLRRNLPRNRTTP